MASLSLNSANVTSLSGMSRMIVLVLEFAKGVDGVAFGRGEGTDWKVFDLCL